MLSVHVYGSLLFFIVHILRDSKIIYPKNDAAYEGPKRSENALHSN